jgi:Flp pilus assembly protein CpaB
VVAFLLASLCAAAAFGLVRSQSAKLDALDPGAQVPVVVAARDLPEGAELTEGDLTVASWPSAHVPTAALSDPAEAIGRRLTASLAAGEPVTQGRVASGGELAATVGEGLVAIAVAAQTVPDGLAEGDRVDLLATFTAERPYTSQVATDVRVIGLGGEATGFGAGGDGARVVLELDAVQARAVAAASATAVLTIAVRSAATIAQVDSS